MPGTHSDLHRLKHTKNLLADQLGKFHQTLGSVKLGTHDTARLQCTVAFLRREVRALHLADCYIRGRPYGVIEDVKNRKTAPDWERVKSVVTQHGGPINGNKMPTIEDWSMSN